MSAKKIIAREGLIVIGIALLLYSLFSIINKFMPVVYPKYRAEFADGRVYVVEVYPDVNYAKVFNPKAFLKDTYSPPSALVSRRIEEFAKRAKIDSAVKEAKCVNRLQLYFSGIYSAFSSQPLLLKTLSVYFLLLILRFIFWAAKVLKRPTAALR